ncbi:hypothetical protein F5Y08DRAFT_90845 [Xylaria arbuscula]|nr:hypothetical protein F5Y08DRAFT_90845 [Xylaria arbuscula]
MLPRQLHRPLLRSVTAAAWRPATLSPTPYYYRGDSRSISSNSSRSSQQQKEGEGEGEEEENRSSDQHGESSSQAPIEKKPSLFEQLLPEEAKAMKNGGDKYPWASVADEEPPRLALPEDLRNGKVDGKGEKGKEGGEKSPSAQDENNDAPDFYTPATRAKSMLILFGASKNLQESDFLRLGVKGAHVEGWVGPGILKVIQARDQDTLEPKGHYFILFDSDASASAYRDRVQYLWRLGKTHVPGAHHARSHMQQQPLPRRGGGIGIGGIGSGGVSGIGSGGSGLWRTENGEDISHLIRTFTLVPPSQRLNLVQSKTSPAKITQVYLEGGFVHQLAARAGSKFLVHVRLDGGRLSVDTLRRAIRDDGERRHLEWRITDLDKNKGGGILPFGKSILKAKDRVHVSEGDPPNNNTTTTTNTNTKTNAAREGPPPGEDPTLQAGFNNNEILDAREYSEMTGQSKSSVNAAQEAEESNERYRQYPRFIIPFLDQAEAHRFVQNWHRRELKLRLGGSGEKGDPSWQETRTINATVLW